MNKIKIYMFMLLFLFSLSLSHINCKAYTTYSDNCTSKLLWNNGNNSDDWHITFNPNNVNNIRGVYCNDPALLEALDTYVHDYEEDLTTSYDSEIEWVFITNNPEYRLSASRTGGSGGDYPTGAWWSNPYYNSKFNNLMTGAGFQSNEYGITYFGTGSYSSGGLNFIRSFDFQNDVNYVTTVKDAYKYLINNDSSVIKNGNPEDAPVTQDNTLPVPQCLTCDIHNKYTGSTPFLIGGWSNPANSSFDAIKDSVKIHIQYKPKFQYYKRFISVKDDVVSSRDWINLGIADNKNKNKWVNCFPNTPQTDSNVVKFETLKADMESIANLNNLYAGGATLDNGTSWRIRYEMPDGRVSYWAVYNINGIGKVTYADDVTFQDNEDNVVSSDAVDYQNSLQTDPTNQDRDNSLLGRLKTALNNLQSLPKDMQNVADEGSSFANFLKKVWEKFPEIYFLFIGGLIIAIILRVLGR